MKTIFLLVIIILCCLSCENDKKTTILIKNKTHLVIDTLKIIYGTEKENKEYNKNYINPKALIDIELDMNLKGIDGGYSLEIYQEGERRSKYFGYYSNAMFKNETYDVEVKKDTLIIKHVITKKNNKNTQSN